MHLESSNPAVMQLSLNATTAGTASLDIPLANGDVSFSYYIHGMDVTGDATITVTASGFTNRTGTVHVVPPALRLTGVPASMTSLDPTDTFVLQVGVPAGASPNTFVSPAQAVRIGGSSVVVTVTNTNGAVAQLVTQGGSAQSRMVTIAPGQSSSPATLATGGIAFDPIGGGSTTVRPRRRDSRRRMRRRSR